MSSGAASAYWRVAGMSYLKYSNLCADMVRAALKEPAKSAALKRETIFFRGTKWAEGKPGESGETPWDGRRRRISLSLSLSLSLRRLTLHPSSPSVLTDFTEHIGSK